MGMLVQIQPNIISPSSYLSCCPPTTSSGILKVGWASETGLPGRLFHGPDPKFKVIPYHIDLFEDLRPIACKNRTPHRLCHRSFSIRYPSLTSKTKSPLTVLTCPPPIFFTNNPLSTERTIPSGFVVPGTIIVLLILGIGLCW